MPIQQRREDRFSLRTAFDVLQVHRLGVIFLLLVPLLFFLIVGQFTDNFFGVWPSQFQDAYEHLLIFGAAGVYLLGLLRFLLPQLFDISLHDSEKKKLGSLFAFYVFGLIIVLFSALSTLFDQTKFLFLPLLSVGSLIEFMGWFLSHAIVFRAVDPADHEKLHVKFLQISSLMFVSSKLLLPVFYILANQFSLTHLPIFWRYSLRVFPLLTAGMLLVAFILRLAPETFGWRPMDAKKLKYLIPMFILSCIGTVSGNVLFHVNYEVPYALVYAISLFLFLITILGVFVSEDLLHIRLLPRQSKIQVMFLYSSLIWFFIAASLAIIFGSWELFNERIVSGFWMQGLYFVFFIGVIMQGIFGIYAYIIDETEGRNLKWGVNMNIIYALLTWGLILRAFIYPVTVLYHWHGIVLFKWVLFAIVFLAFILMAWEMYFSLYGNSVDIIKKQLKK